MNIGKEQDTVTEMTKYLGESRKNLLLEWHNKAWHEETIPTGEIKDCNNYDHSSNLYWIDSKRDSEKTTVLKTIFTLDTDIQQKNLSQFLRKVRGVTLIDRMKNTQIKKLGNKIGMVKISAGDE